MRNIEIAPGEYYHLLNRGNDKQNIFRDDRDRIRFLFLILHLQSPKVNFPQIGRSVTYYVRNGTFDTEAEIIVAIDKSRDVELIALVLMPNHFHLIVREIKEGGISRYMMRMLAGYTKYFNTKYSRVGHLFQGPFKAVHVQTNEQLLYLSAYTHRNPRELRGWAGKEDKYPWSSYRDYLGKNRWGKLLKPDIVLDQFKNPQNYRKEVESSGAKEMPDEIYLE